jgi:GxxExxY protein
MVSWLAISLPTWVIEDTVLVENKAVQTLAKAHEVQLVNYLAATGIDIGLLLNFGASSLQVKRKYRTYVSQG